MIIPVIIVEAFWLFIMFIVMPACSFANGEWQGGVKGEIYDPFFKWAKFSWFSANWTKTIIGIALLGLPILLLTTMRQAEKWLIVIIILAIMLIITLFCGPLGIR